MVTIFIIRYFCIILNRLYQSTPELVSFCSLEQVDVLHVSIESNHHTQCVFHERSAIAFTVSECCKYFLILTIYGISFVYNLFLKNIKPYI